jgi:hypothetical protein
LRGVVERVSCRVLIVKGSVAEIAATIKIQLISFNYT